MSDQGERGDTGIQGATGERGQKGDHGQPGEAGRTGIAGAVGAAGAEGAEGAPGQPGLSPDPRAFIKSVRRLLYLLVTATVVLYVALGGFAYYVFTKATTNEEAIDLIESEGRDRRDQSCRGLELGHKQEIVDLQKAERALLRTLQFYEGAPPAFKNLLKNPLVQQGLRDDKRDARIARRDAMNDQDRFGVFVPLYCDEKGFGLPEPDPVVPKRPKGL